MVVKSSLPLSYSNSLFNFFSHSDIDECALNVHNCTGTEVCTNIDGDFTCPCISGYGRNGIDECEGM